MTSTSTGSASTRAGISPNNLAQTISSSSGGGGSSSSSSSILPADPGRKGLPNIDGEPLGGPDGVVDGAAQGAALVLGGALGEALLGALGEGGDGGPLVDADAAVGRDDVLHDVPHVLRLAPRGRDGHHVALPQRVGGVVDELVAGVFEPLCAGGERLVLTGHSEDGVRIL